MYLQVLYHKALNSNDNELVEAGYECMKKFISGFQVDMDTVQQFTGQMLRTLQDYRNLNINFITRLCYLAELFPTVFSERLSDQLLQLLKKWLEAALVGSKTQQPVPQGANKVVGQVGVGGGQPQLKVAAAIVKLFTKIPPPSEPAKVILPLSKLILTTEKTLLIEPGSILRAPLKAYLRKFPSEAVDFFLTADSAKGWIHQSSLSDLNSDLGRISSN